MDVEVYIEELWFVHYQKSLPELAYDRGDIFSTFTDLDYRDA